VALHSFLAHAALEAGDNQAGAGQDALQLMTVHAAKGLEFDTVFLTGLEEGLFPHENSLSEADGLEEERRLMYVAITRARRRLNLSFAQSRMLHGQTRYGLRSRFIDELPAKTVTALTPRLRAGFASAAESAAQQARGGIWALRDWPGGAPGDGSAGAGAAGAGSGLRIGQGVRHARFGDGVVVRLQGSGSDARAQINFGAFGVKELLLAVANLQTS
jgi:ATP-dependent DNA helicase UvrD/PcrA